MRTEVEIKVVKWLIIVLVGLWIWIVGFLVGIGTGKRVCDGGQVYVVDSGECVAEDDHKGHLGE